MLWIWCLAFGLQIGRTCLCAARYFHLICARHRRHVSGSATVCCYCGCCHYLHLLRLGIHRSIGTLHIAKYLRCTFHPTLRILRRWIATRMVRWIFVFSTWRWTQIWLFWWKKRKKKTVLVIFRHNQMIGKYVLDFTWSWWPFVESANFDHCSMVPLPLIKCTVVGGGGNGLRCRELPFISITFDWMPIPSKCSPRLPRNLYRRRIDKNQWLNFIVSIWFSALQLIACHVYTSRNRFFSLSNWISESLPFQCSPVLSELEQQNKRDNKEKHKLTKRQLTCCPKYEHWTSSLLYIDHQVNGFYLGHLCFSFRLN